MVNQQLVDYIKQQLQGGVGKDAIKKALLDAGWPPADVDDSLSTAGSSSSPAASVAQQTVNPFAAMGGGAAGQAAAAAGVKADNKFFADRPADTGAAPHKGGILTIILSVVIVILLGLVGYMWWSGRNSGALPALTNEPSAELQNLQTQLQTLNQDKASLTTQMSALTAANQAAEQELAYLVPQSTSTELTVRGNLALSGTTYTLTTVHNIAVIVKNSKDVKVDAALKPLVGQSVELKGMKVAGALNVIMVNGVSPFAPPAPAPTSTPPTTAPSPVPPAGTSTPPGT